MAVTKELKSLTRKVARLEREYYGDKRTVYSEAEKYAYPVKRMMKALWMFDLNKASEVEEMIRQSAIPERYKDDPKHAMALNEVYAKIKSFLPHRTSALVEACQGLLNILERYCVSFYDSESDCYLETPAHYSEQIAVWKEKAEMNIQSARSLYRKFTTSGITTSMLSQPVAAFCSRCDIHKLLFLVMFADACTHIRSALSVMSLWLKTDGNYASYVKNDLAELEKLKEEKMKVLRETRQKCHSLTYSLTKLETDHSRLAHEMEAMKEKEHCLRIDEVSFVNALNDMDLEIEFKEKRRENLRKRPSVSELSESSVETYDSLTNELKSIKEKYPGVVRALGQVRMKLSQVDNKQGLLDKVHRDVQATKKDLKEAEDDRNMKEQEYTDVEEAAQLARKILLCKTANDATEKLYYSVPFGTKTIRTKGEDKDPVSRACKIISSRVEKDWLQLYRKLAFYPQRGEETIEHDIVELSELGARTSASLTCALALDRWKRYHTRANVEDLRQALRKIRRFDILKIIDEGLKSPVKESDPFEIEEEAPPPVGPELLPYYKLIERYDQIRASKVKS